MPLANRTLTAVENAKRNVVNGEFEVMRLEAADAGREFIYPAQQRVADAIVKTFADEDALLMTMVAPMQWGKTGVMASRSIPTRSSSLPGWPTTTGATKLRSGFRQPGPRTSCTAANSRATSRT